MSFVLSSFISIRLLSSSLFNLSFRSQSDWVNVTKWKCNGCSGDSSSFYPGSSGNTQDTATFSAQAGVVALSTDIVLARLNMFGGTLLAHSSSCPPGWTVSTLSSPGYKCYKMFENATDYFSASAACRASGLGSLDSRLVIVDSAEELQIVRGLCRGNASSLPFQRGCWLGLYDGLGNGTFRWEESIISPKKVDVGRFQNSFIFFDWKRFSRNNMTVSGGANIEDYRRCVHMGPWQMDPLVQEQGTMEDTACGALKPYVCQAYAATQKYEVAVTTEVMISNGELIGGKTTTLNPEPNSPGLYPEPNSPAFVRIPNR